MDDNLDRNAPTKSASDPASYSRNQSPIWNKLGKFFRVFSNRTTAIAGILLLVVGVGAGIIAVQRSTEYRQQASISETPLPGTCLVLPQEFCGAGQAVIDPSGNFQGMGFDLPDNTPIFAYDDGVLTSSFINVATSTYRGVSLSTAANINANTYFKDSITSDTTGVSKSIKKGELVGHTQKDPQNPYDLLVNFSKLGNNTNTIDQGLTTTNFSK